MAAAAGDVARIGGSLSLNLRKVKIKDAQAFVGCACRSPFTGRVSLVGTEDAMNFTLVDIWTRGGIAGLPVQLSKEKYIFKPQVLDKRTWIFQNILETRKECADAGEAAPCVREALAAKCLDITGHKGGDWSPMISYAFMLPVVSFTGELIPIFAGTLTFMLTLIIALQMNTPKYCNLARAMSLPVRLLFIFYLMTMFDVATLLESGLVLKVLAIAIALGIGAYDIVKGDVSVAMSASNAAWFDILRELPNRVYICRYRGPPGAVRDFKQGKNTLDESITGMKTKETPDVCLIADVHGLLCVLQPMSPEDWEELYHHASKAGEEIRFAGVNLYNMARQTLAHFDEPEAFLKDPSQHLVQLRDGRIIQRKDIVETSDTPMHERTTVRWGSHPDS